MTHIQLDGPARRPWKPDVLVLLAGIALGVGSALITVAVTAPPTVVEMAPARLARDWTITVKGTVPDSQGVRLVCEPARAKP